jgi:hypothetical protein
LWNPVGFGVLSQQNLRFGGTYDATNSTVITVSTFGTQAGLTSGDAIPIGSNDIAGVYLVCQTPGSAVTVPNVEADTHKVNDWIVCLGEKSAWMLIENSTGGGGGGGVSVLNDLLDVSIDDGTPDTFSFIAPRVALADDQLLKYNATDGVWRNTSIIAGGTF